MKSVGFLFASAGFVVGIFIRSFYILPWEASAFVATLAVIIFGAWFFTRRPAYAIIGIILLAFFAGGSRVAVSPMSLPNVFHKQLGSEVTLVGIISSAPDIRDTGTRIIVDVSEDGGKTRILANVSRAENVAYGERVRLHGKLEAPKPFATEYGRVFRYDRHLAVKGVFATMSHATLVEVSPPSGLWVRLYGSLIKVKQIFLNSLAKALPEPEASLAGGIVAGGTQGLGTKLLDDFVRSGLIHVVVLSGYNVMIVAEVVLLALAFLSRKWATSIAVIVIGSFVLMAGAGASSIRAGLMAFFALVAIATGRTYDVTRALVVAVLLMLLWNPLLLAFSLGFDLSVIATLGLILGVPLIEPKLTFIRSAFLREIIASTMSAQVAVAPLLLYVNGLFSLVALPANILVLPFVPLAMAMSAMAGAVAFVAPVIAPLAGLPAYIILHYITGVVHFTAHIPLATFAVPVFSFAWVVAFYILLALFVDNITPRKTLLTLPAPVEHIQF